MRGAGWTGRSPGGSAGSSRTRSATSRRGGPSCGPGSTCCTAEHGRRGGMAIPGRAEPPGRPLGVGRTADVYDLGGGRVLRRFHDRSRSAEREAEIISWAGDHGVAVPEVFDADGPDIVMEKIDGPTMLADLARRPWWLFRHAATLARTGSGHRSATATPCCTWTCIPTTCCWPSEGRC